MNSIWIKKEKNSGEEREEYGAQIQPSLSFRGEARNPWYEPITQKVTGEKVTLHKRPTSQPLNGALIGYDTCFCSRFKYNKRNQKLPALKQIASGKKGSHRFLSI
jgi:hypothetical protein